MMLCVIAESWRTATMATEESIFTEVSKDFLTLAIQILLPLSLAILVIVIAVDLWQDH